MTTESGSTAPPQKDHGRAGRDLKAAVVSAIVLLAAIAASLAVWKPAFMAIVVIRYETNSRTSGIAVLCPYLCRRHHRHYSLDKFLFSCLLLCSPLVRTGRAAIQGVP